MKVEVKTKVTKEVEEVRQMELIKYYVVRIVKVSACEKKVISETEFSRQPTEEEIANCLVNHFRKNIFASVVENYKLTDEGGSYGQKNL